MTASRKTPTRANGGNDNGIVYTDAVDAEIGALWRYIGEPLTNVAGTGDAITADAISGVVSAVLAIQEGKKFHFTASAANTGAATIAIDGIAAKTIKDVDGATLQAGAIVSGRRHIIEFDGTDFRLLNAAAGAVTVEYGSNGGRLTNSTGVPVLTTAVTAATLLYWAPYEHNRIALYDGAAWSIIQSVEKSVKATDAQTGDTHNGTKVLDNLTDTSQLVVGMEITGTGIGVGAVIQSVDSATQVTASVNSTASASVTITFKLPANTGYDVFGKSVSSALALRLVPRAALFTATTLTTQDGVPVKSGDATLRHLGWFKTSNTAGQIDYAFSGQYRFPIWNRCNKVYRHHCEAFAATATYHKSPCTVRGTAIVNGAGGGLGTSGGLSSFGSHCSAAGGVAGGGSAHSSGSGGDANWTGYGGMPSLDSGGLFGGSYGGRTIESIAASALNATETVTVGAVGTGGSPSVPGWGGGVEFWETLET